MAKRTIKIACQGAGTLALDKLEEFQGNLKDLSIENFERLKREIIELGFSEPFSVWRDHEHNWILNGHQRRHVLLALDSEGWEIPPLPVSWVEAEDYKQAKMKVLALTSQYGNMTEQGLYEFISTANIEIDFAVERFSFPEIKWEEFKTEFYTEPPVEELPDKAGELLSKADELQAKWQVKTGDLWKLGEHKLICGDCTDKAVVERVMGEEKASLLFTSPPYSDMRIYGNNDLSIETLSKIFPEWKDLVNVFCINLGLQYKNSEVYPYWDYWIKAAKDVGLKLLSWNVWDRIHATSVSHQSKMFALQHEWVFCFGEKPKSLNRTWEKSETSKLREKYYTVNQKGQKVTARRQQNGSMKNGSIGMIHENKNMGTVFSGYSERTRDLGHPARFPIELPAGYIEAITDLESIVVDPFLGSGTTIIACERLGRKCRAVEIVPAYVAVAIQRWVDLTGGTPELLST